MQNIKLGRLFVADERDKNYPLSKTLAKQSLDNNNKTYKYWWSSAWWGDQGSTPQCVAYAWMHWLEDGPVTHFYEKRDFDPMYLNENNPGKHQSLFNPQKIYENAQNVDRWPGNNYDGTSVRAGAKILQSLGVIKEYRWAQNIDDVVKSVLNLGPMVVGTVWYNDMFYPNQEGVIKPNGQQAGGHAYVLNGVNIKKGYFRLKNSWGINWGNRGHAYISINDFEKLLNYYGEACMAFEKRLEE